jgi:hypothetical protein
VSCVSSSGADAQVCLDKTHAKNIEKVLFFSFFLFKHVILNKRTNLNSFSLQILNTGDQ